MDRPHSAGRAGEDVGIDEYERSDGWRGDFEQPGVPIFRPPSARPPGAQSGNANPAASSPSAGLPRASPAAPRREPYPGPDWSVITVGEPGYDFEPKPPATPSYRPDTVHDGWSTDMVTVRLASVRGYSHRYEGRPREDDVAVAVHQPTQSVVFAVADGVSSAEQSSIGSALACRGAVNNLLRQLDSGVPAVDWPHVVRTAAWQLVARAAAGREPEGAYSEEAERKYATTLVTGVVRVDALGVPEVSLVQVGDSGAWLLDRSSGRYQRLLATKDSYGTDVLSSAVTPLPRVPSPLPVQQTLLGPASVLLVGTDGFGDALGDGTGAVGELFHRHLRAPLPSRGLAHLLDFSRETFDDDRTLLAIWPRHLLREPRR
ncbi:protein phosphatase 2C domain-containing protein [Streptomyces sp. NBC_01190]|uniref:protein phosphatase 2C domain-containing protein n=1 Tax=Streptomyces sp. NBC_01190 TaxID=2903767 RepID=UPI00386BF3FE|nr:protein phosphatase 2C domain-containing protein [Streptomyces sp. NBC_01190]